MYTQATLENFMAQFPSKEECERAIAQWKTQNKNAHENEAKVMEHYYDCLDDYSWGGIGTRAYEEGVSARNMYIRLIKEQMETGNTELLTDRVQVLTDMNNKVVSDKIVNARFGDCWIIPNGDEKPAFIGKAQKASTYAKKGYKVMTVVYEVEYYYIPKECKLGLIPIARILSKTMVEPVEGKDNYELSEPRTKLRTPTFFALNLKDFENK
jgi:hypothetical protein